jgi:conserved oligomeric Golgi complex subunit 8
MSNAVAPTHLYHQHQDEPVGSPSKPWSALLSETSNKNPHTLDERQIAKAALDAAEEQLQSLCAGHSGTFVSVERRGRMIRSTLDELATACENVINNEALLSQKKLEQNEEEELEVGDDDEDKNYSSKQRTPSLSTLAERHRVRRRTLLQHSALIELLELPSLMDACIRSNLYEEAIQIASFSNTLERRHSVTAIPADTSNLHGGNSVVAQVVMQIRSRQNDFRRHLLYRLKTYVTMPECLEIVTSLRRLDSIDLERMTLAPSDAATVRVDKEKLHSTMESKLQIDFLEARDVWIDAITPTMFSAVSATAVHASRQQLTSAMMTGPQSQEQFSDTIERYRTR